MADEQLLSRVHSLSDLELALLLSLIAREHCQIRTPSSAIHDVVAELQLISTKIFRLQPTVVSCTPHTTLDEFASALLLPSQSLADSPVLSTHRSPSPFTTRSPRSHRHPSHDPQSSYFQSTSTQPLPASNPSIAPIVIAANLDTAPKAVQIQALELLRTRRVFTRTSVHAAPKTFLFIAVISDDRQGGGLNRWLNDWFYLAHRHSVEDRYPNLEEEDAGSGHALGLGLGGISGVGDNTIERSHYGPADDAASTASSESVVVKPSGLRVGSSSAFSWDRRPSDRGGKMHANGNDEEPLITETDISLLAQLSQQVHVDIDVTCYQMNIVSFFRMHHAVAAGVTPTATKHFEQLMKSLAPLHGLDYVTPSLVQLAARKVYLHRIQIVAPEHERSMQWGSELAAVEAVLDGIGPEDVIEDILGMVSAPL